VYVGVGVFVGVAVGVFVGVGDGVIVGVLVGVGVSDALAMPAFEAIKTSGLKKTEFI
jgi:hypothetical protein